MVSVWNPLPVCRPPAGSKATSGRPSGVKLSATRSPVISVTTCGALTEGALRADVAARTMAENRAIFGADFIDEASWKREPMSKSRQPRRRGATPSTRRAPAGSTALGRQEERAQDAFIGSAAGPRAVRYAGFGAAAVSPRPTGGPPGFAGSRVN